MSERKLSSVGLKSGGISGIRHGAKAIMICSLVAVLAAIGCNWQAETANPASGNPAPTPAAQVGNPGESSSPTPRPAQVAAPPTASPSPTEQDPSPTADSRPPTATPTAMQPPSHPATQPSSPTPTASLTPTPWPSPTPILPPSPTPTPALRQLTTGGCCTQPFWSPDSHLVLFIDRPGPDAPVGIWGVDVTRPDAAPELVLERIGYYTADMAFITELDRDVTVIERLADGARWTVPAGGRPVSISPGQKRIAWQVSDDDANATAGGGIGPFERRTTAVWVAHLDGTNAQLVATLYRGSLSGWISDDVLLLSSRESLDAREQVLYTLSLTSGRTTELVRSERLRGGLLSPHGTWLAYYVALDADPTRNGLWLVRTDGSARRQLDRRLFGAYQWRDADRLLIIPFRPAAVSHELWQFDVDTGEARRLTDPAVTPFKIANGDWRVSPDGRYVAFVASRDRNIWVITLNAR